MNNDLISREALREAFHKRIYYFDKSSWDEANALIDNAPTVTPIYPVTQTGKWIKITKDGITPIEYVCSNCGRTVKSYYDEYIITKDFPFCHCGADMRGEEE